MTTHRDFFKGLTPFWGFSARIQAVKACAVVSILESPGGDNHWNNPLASTRYWDGATYFNSFGENDSMHVWRYLTPRDGQQATAELMSGSRWDGVRHAMQYGRTRNDVLDAFRIAYSTWGSHIDFVNLPYNNFSSIHHRLVHTLQPYAPKDPWQ